MNSLFEQKRILAASLILTLVACTTPPKQLPTETKPVTPPVTSVPPTVSPTVPPTAPPKLAPITNYTQAYKLSSYSEMPGWGNDDLREAWPAFVNSCSALKNKAEWKEVCGSLKNVEPKNLASIRAFFEMNFSPYQVKHLDGATDGMVTGYYEPLLKGSRTKGGVYQTALYAVPNDMLTIELGSVYPDLKNMRLRGRLVSNKVVPYA